MEFLKRFRKRKRMAEKTIEELRIEVTAIKDENKKLKEQNRQLKTTLREERLKKKEWHQRYIKLRERLDELK